MFLDNLLVVSDTQAFGAGAVSTNSIDMGVGMTTPGRQIGTGEKVGFAFAIDVAGTVAPSILEIISATDAALTAGIVVHSRRDIALADAVAGALFFLGLPPGTPTNRFLGVRVTTAGGTISLTSWLTDYDLFSMVPRAYPKGYVV
jgi:hypothetical protein